eukprot:CAMPEP_0118645888 /NCGR_PEP_ID=MMETSP0785-20121206/7750_1 /TAXON_ID=91992 /ORGANISM="Bolidomonas pacifica, Strain CCMP 1866" /LENGTH=62 /DNA_ID=CAMNT_0006537819 /DNA_START=75 /DNA_END=259 /DNA_ORIENTATION=+
MAIIVWATERNDGLRMRARRVFNEWNSEVMGIQGIVTDMKEEEVKEVAQRFEGGGGGGGGGG